MANASATAVAGSFYPDHDNLVVAELLRNKEIGVADRSADGTLTLGVKMLDAKARLAVATATVLGHSVSFKHAQPLNYCH